MRLESEIKLDYKDVLIRPKRSTLTSRAEVNLSRQYTFRNSGNIYNGVPIMAANMDGVGTFEMAETISEHGLFTCLVKNYSKHDIVAWLDNGKGRLINNNWAYSMGITQYDLDKLDTVMGNSFPDDIRYICMDVANGYSERFSETVAKVRESYPKVTIIAGNVVTGEMTEELILSGADIVKVGIGPGCFAPGQKVKTDTGLKNIEDIKQGEKVLTHTGSYKIVTNTFKFNDKKSIININGIKATPNHEFYVLHKKHRDVVTDENIHQYAEWVEAKDLTKDYLLLKHK